jgi:hypothetical protein
LPRHSVFAKAMDPRFIPYVENLHDKMQALLSMAPVKPTNLPRAMCRKGVYLLSEGEIPLYVGRSNHISKRLSRHWRPGATHRMAAFAFLMARKATGNLKATYKKGAGSRAGLIAEPDFLNAFNDAKAHIGQMNVRFVEETDPTKQALLEIYVSVVLQTPYNDFDNH